jgi:hypothetical protein
MLRVKWMLAGTLLAAAAGAAASIPSGLWIGPWHVVSISSLSGVSNDDAAVILAQETAAGTLEANWEEGGPVHVSIRIRDCRDEDRDFQQHYRVPVERWLQLRGGGGRRLEADFAAWLAQARLECRNGTRLDAFRLDRIRPAAAEFTARLRILSPTG